MDSIGKWLILLGILLAVTGGLIWLFTKWGIPFGKLPGDISLSKGDSTFYFPIVTSIVVSIVLTIFLNILLYFFRNKG